MNALSPLLSFKTIQAVWETLPYAVLPEHPFSLARSLLSCLHREAPMMATFVHDIISTASVSCPSTGSQAPPPPHARPCPEPLPILHYHPYLYCLSSPLWRPSLPPGAFSFWFLPIIRVIVLFFLFPSFLINLRVCHIMDIKEKIYFWVLKLEEIYIALLGFLSARKGIF